MIPIKWFQSAGSREPDRNGGGAMIPIKWFQSAGSREPDQKDIKTRDKQLEVSIRRLARA